MSTRADENSSWSEPANIGYPLNTADDNTSFALLPDGVTGYIAAVMPDGFGNGVIGEPIKLLHALEKVIESAEVLWSGACAGRLAQPSAIGGAKCPDDKLSHFIHDGE